MANVAATTEWVTCPQPQVCHVIRHKRNSSAYIRCTRSFSSHLALNSGISEERILGIKKASTILSDFNKSMVNREYQKEVTQYKRTVNKRDDLKEALDEHKKSIGKDDAYYELAEKLYKAEMEVNGATYTMNQDLNRKVYDSVKRMTDKGRTPDNALDWFNGEILGTTAEDTGQPGSISWLEARRKGFGGSDMATVILGAPKDRNSLVKDKITPTTEANFVAQSVEEMDAIQRGSMLESVNALEFQAQYPQVNLVRDKRTYTSENNPNLICNFDGLIEEGGEIVGVWESKTTNNWKEWENGIPREVQAQLDHQMYVSGTDIAYCSVRTNGNQMKTFVRAWGEPIKDPNDPDGKEVYYEDYLGVIDDLAEKVKNEDVTSSKPRKWKPKRNANTESIVRGLFGEKGIDALNEAEGDDAEKFAQVFASQQVNPNRVFTILDTETTGFSRSGNEIIEIGGVKVTGSGVVLDRFDRIYSPDERFLANRGTGAEGIHGISPDMVRGRPNFRGNKQEQQDLVDFIKGSDAIVGHNFNNFDRQMLAHASKEYRETIDDIPVVDTMNLSIYFDHDSGGNELKDFAANNGASYGSNNHRAIDDVETTAQALFDYGGFLDKRREI